MTTIILAALLIAFALGGLFLLRRRSDPPEEDPRGPDTEVQPTQTGPVLPKAAPKAENFDPGATQVYLRPETGGSAAPVRREGANAVFRLRLVGVSGSHKGQTFEVRTTGLRIGRNTDADIVLTDTRVSGRHAWVGIVDGRAVLRDLDSTNGTFLNAQIRAPVTEAELRHGDTISLGGHQVDQFRVVLD